MLKVCFGCVPNVIRNLTSFFVYNQSKQVRFEMNVIGKNINFCIKNQQKIRFYFSIVRPKAVETSVNIGTCQRVPISSNFCERNIRTNYNALKIQVFRFSSDCTLTQLRYEKFCAETLESIGDYLEELVESVSDLATADVLNKVSFKL